MIILETVASQSSDVFYKVFYGISILLPSAIAALSVLRKGYFKKQFKKLEQSVSSLNVKVDSGFSQNIKQHQDITQTLLAHTQTISQIIREKTIATRLRQVAKHAIQYCGNRDLGKIINTFTQQFICFVQQITDIGFQNTNKQQIIAKLSVARDNSNKYALGVFSVQQLKQ